jgi:hypothetical protein
MFSRWGAFVQDLAAAPGAVDHHEPQEPTAAPA